MQNSSCVASMGEPLLFFSTKSEVRGLKVNSMEYFPVSTNLPYVIGIGFLTVLVAGSTRLMWRQGRRPWSLLSWMGLVWSALSPFVSTCPRTWW